MTRKPIGLSIPHRKVKPVSTQPKANMTLAEFADYVSNQQHEAIYVDSEGRTIVVLRMLDLYCLVNDVVKHAEKK